MSGISCRLVTLLVVYSGTGDPREMARMQEMQRRYKREFQTKKWDELSVKWTDVEGAGVEGGGEGGQGRGLGFCVLLDVRQSSHLSRAVELYD